jgi:hypothetical protein
MTPGDWGSERPQMLGEKCDPSVIGVIPVTRPLDGSKLHEALLLSPVKLPARYCPAPLKYSAYSSLSLSAGEEGMAAF